ncbi:hypothetical protein SLA2020_348250 [Shorea laevis]
MIAKRGDEPREERGRERDEPLATASARRAVRPVVASGRGQIRRPGLAAAHGQRWPRRPDLAVRVRPSASIRSPSASSTTTGYSWSRLGSSESPDSIGGLAHGSSPASNSPKSNPSRNLSRFISLSPSVLISLKLGDSGGGLRRVPSEPERWAESGGRWRGGVVRGWFVWFERNER